MCDPLEVIDKALEIASRPGVIFCSFGDMLRVPGTGRDLFQVRSAGGDVRVVYSPLDALRIARQNPDREVVFFGIGFETTAPPNAMTVYQARKLGIANFSLLVSHVRVPPAIEAIMRSPTCRVQGFLAAGHVCSVMGVGEYPELADRFRVPIVVTGFEPWTSSKAYAGPWRSWSAANTPSTTPTPVPSARKGTRPRGPCWRTSSRSPTGPGEASA